ncbi:MAG: VanZ family protein, partial [Paramuribaculum sp.]|nr:VanZ family protein [Paramuribaculum sp.]
MKKLQSCFQLLNAFPLGMASAIILCIICITTLMPPSGVPSVSIPNIDKVVHALFFGALSTVFIFDASLYLKRTDMNIYIACALASTIIGALIEIAQDAMGLGRSGDWYDLMADAAGAFAIPLLFKRIIARLTIDYSLKLSEVKKSSRIPAAVRKLYFDSFPPDEQRPWH